MPYLGNGLTKFTTADELTVTGDATAGGTLGVTGVVTANAGVVVDNITIDGTEIDLSSGDLTIDVASDLIFDADDGAFIYKDGGTEIFRIGNSSSSAALVSAVSNKDIILKGNDGGSTITALTLDMSDAGKAIFNAGASFSDAVGIGTSVPDSSLTIATSSSGEFNALSIRQANNTSGNESRIRFTRTTDAGSDREVAAIVADRVGGNDTALAFEVNTDGADGAVEKARLRHDGTLLLGATSVTASGSPVLETIGAISAIKNHTDTSSSGNVAYGAGNQALTLGNNQGGADDQTAKLGFSVTTTGSTSDGLIEFGSTAAGTGDLRFYVESGNTLAKRMTLTSGGNVNIGGTSSTRSPLVIANSSSQISLTDADGSSNIVDIRKVGGPDLTFDINGSEKLRLEADGKFRINATANQVTGYEIFTCNGSAGFKSSDTNVAGIWQTSSSGHFIQFFGGSGAAGCGNIGFINNNNLIISNDADNSGLQFGSGSITPSYDGAGQDNSVDLGSSSTRFRHSYFANTVYTASVAGVGDTDTYLNFPNNNIIQFYTNGSERARFTSGGNFRINQSSTDSPGLGNTTIGVCIRSDNIVAISSASGYVSVNRNGDGTRIQFNNSGNTRGSITVTGTSTAYNTSSDRRLKSNIQDATSASAKIDAMQVRQFDWTEDGSHQDYGMIAQELKAIEPLAVSGSEDGEEMMGVDYSKLVPMLIKEIQELRGRVAALEAS